MRVFLFLYPIKDYVEFSIQNNFLLERGLDPKRLSQIIDYRYRKRGYKVVWLLFSQGRWLHKPDRRRFSEIFEVVPEDLVLGCGVSFANHCANRHYPNLSYVFSQLPNPIDELVVGGFHQWDCVDKAAAFAHRKGITVRVDEDTTQFFFSTTASDGPIPLRRRGPDLYKLFSRFGDDWMLEFVTEKRKKRPWFDQIEQPG